MPQGGRPSGARLGRYRMGWLEEPMRVEELDSDDDEDGVLLDPFLDVQRFGREELRLVRTGNTSRGKRPGDYEYNDDVSEYSNDDGTEDLGGDPDSRGAYLPQLTSRDKEDLRVEKALDRIRRAQMLGRKRVDLSPRELEALERRR